MPQPGTVSGAGVGLVDLTWTLSNVKFSVLVRFADNKRFSKSLADVMFLLRRNISDSTATEPGLNAIMMKPS